jgi:hypothetical protein
LQNIEQENERTTPRIEVIPEEDETESTPITTQAAKPTIPKNAVSAPIAAPVIQEVRNVEQTPEHPFRHAKDAIYTPPQVRNVGAIPKVTAPVNSKKPEPAYRTTPAIHDAKIANTVYQRALDTHLTITYHELLSLSPEVRAQIRDATSSKRVAPKDSAQSNLLEESDLTEDELSYLMPDEMILNDIEPTYTSTTMRNDEGPHLTPGSIVIEDPIEKYYKSLGPDEEPDADKIIVAKESSALRSIMPLVDNNMKVEAILDPGCQIVAMSEDICHELGLAYDPKIVLHMQSANGTVDPSLGLARNIPFHIGHLTLYMQVHIIQNPAYDILLGRPFDVLAQSVV